MSISGWQNRNPEHSEPNRIPHPEARVSSASPGMLRTPRAQPPVGLPKGVLIRPEIDESALLTIQDKWKFEPARFDGAPVAAQMSLEFSLRLY